MFSTQTGINPLTAPAAMLRAMPGLDDGQVTEFLEDRAGAIEEGRSEGAVTTETPPGVQFSAAKFHSRIATLRAEEVTGNVARLVREAVVRLENSPTEPFRILAWR